LTQKKKIKEKWQGYGQGRKCPVFYFGMKRSKSMNGKGLWISAEIMAEKRLNMTEKALLAEIHNLAQLGECFAGNEHFAEVLGFKKNWISKLISDLKDKGYLFVTFTYKTGTKEIEKRLLTPIGLLTNTPCTIDQDPIGELTNTPIGELTKDNKQVFKKQVKKQINNNTYIDEFEDLWRIYPNKKGKDKALVAYIKARKEKFEYETIKNGLQKYIKYVQIKQTEKEFIKHGSTFFNQRSWQDEYDTSPSRPKGFMGLLFDEYRGGDAFEQDRGYENFGDFTELLPEPIQEY
jgi:helix-turn-helix protein